jgi:hypothetical protein
VFNPIPSIFGTDYKDGFEKNREWATPALRRHVELVNTLNYVPLIVDVASSALGRDVVKDLGDFIRAKF